MNLRKYFFLTVADKLIQNAFGIDISNEFDMRNVFVEHMEMQSIFIGPVLETDIKEAVGSLKNNTARRLGSINSSLIKAIYDKINSVLLLIFNLSFEVESFQAE